MWTIEQPCIRRRLEIQADIVSSSETVRCWHLMVSDHLCSVGFKDFKITCVKYAKMAEMKWNYMSNMIMNVSGTLCQLIHYFPSKLGLAINLPWPALKSKVGRIFWHHPSTKHFLLSCEKTRNFWQSVWRHTAPHTSSGYGAIKIETIIKILLNVTCFIFQLPKPDLHQFSVWNILQKVWRLNIHCDNSLLNRYWIYTLQRWDSCTNSWPISTI